MAEDSDRKELERRLEQVRRLLVYQTDPATRQRLEKLAHDLEEQLR